VGAGVYKFVLTLNSGSLPAQEYKQLHRKYSRFIHNIQSIPPLLLASALAVTAHPAAQPLEVRDSSTYTCGDAYNDCQGSGQGSYVCWADNKSKTCGRWGGNEMSMCLHFSYWCLRHPDMWVSLVMRKNEPMRNYCRGKAYCCRNDAIVSSNAESPCETDSNCSC
jgi:hypothetical protein